jgi:succinate dehydrogenase / fumarate reductase flavoprotein subunit
MSESLRNDGRVWVPKKRGDTAPADRSPRTSATTTSSASTRASATSCRATSPRAPPRTSATRAAASARAASASTSTSPTRSSGSAATAIEERYGNLFEMYERITGEDPYEVPMRIYPAVHYTMGGLWVDYNLMSTIPGLFVLGEANFSDHGANRLGASALMQGWPTATSSCRTRSATTSPTALREGRRRPPGAFVARRARRAGAHRSCCRSTAPARSTRSTASSARSCGTCAAWRARGGPAQGAGPIPSCARSSGRTSRCARRRRGAQPVAREGRPGRRLPRARRADVPRRAAPRESCGGHFRERARPRRRGAARRRELRLRRGLGVHRRGASPGPAQGAARVRVRPPRQRSYK